MPLFRTLILAIILFALPAFGADISTSIQFARGESHILAALRCSIPEGYHAYSHAPSASGLPTSLKLSLDGKTTAQVFYPPGVEEPDIFDPAAKSLIYKGEVDILAALPLDATGKDYIARLEMLLCSNRHCLPVKRTLSGKIPSNPQAISESGWNIPGLLAELDGESVSLEKGARPGPIAIGPEKDVSGAALRKPAAVLAPPDEFDLQLRPRFAAPELEIYSLGKALLFGLIAGLILNAMPCVLPVLALKVNTLLMAANINNKRKIRLFRIHNLFFAAGVLSLFTALALLLGAADLMWGQLYQNHALLLIMLLLVFLMGLSMLGVFTLPTLNLRLGSKSRSPAIQAYCSGLVCTFLATPCSGPLLGGVLAWAFTQPLPALLAVFWAVGLGMSLPYLMFCVWPSMARILPKPGEWMRVFEQILGFLLLGTALYLLAILPEAKRMHVLSALLAVAFCAWLWGRFCTLTAPAWRRWTGAILGCLLLVGTVVWTLQPQEVDLQWRKFSAPMFMEEYAKKNLLVEFTADWCPNCKYLEATVLTEKNLRAWRKRYKFDLIRVDLTDANPYGERLLAMLGGKSIPLTALFKKGPDASEPLVLRDIYDEEDLVEALRRQFGN